MEEAAAVLPFGQMMQALAKRKRAELRQKCISDKIEDLPESPVKRRRGTFIAEMSPRILALVKQHINHLASDGGGSFILYADREQPTEESEPQALFYGIPDMSGPCMFSCHDDDREYVLDTLIEDLLELKLEVQRLPPAPSKPMQLIQVRWYNIQ
jgi:hypothetical protein